MHRKFLRKSAQIAGKYDLMSALLLSRTVSARKQANGA